MKFLPALTEHQRQDLQRLHRQGATHRQRQRAQAVLLSDEGFTLEQLAAIFQADRDTVSRWLDAWHKGGIAALADAPRAGRPRKLDDALLDALMDILEHPSPNLKAALQADLQKRGAASAGTPSSAPSSGADAPSAAPATSRPRFLTRRQRRATGGG